MTERLYTAEEANALLPELATALAEIREARQVILARGEHLGRVAELNGGGEIGQEMWDALSTLRRRVEALTEMGIVLRDPETGLIDFPARIEGRPAFLCWRLGEERVGFWHGPEGGFAGRRPL
jgi:hypothetical protein